MLNHDRSAGDFAQACKSIPGGVNSPVRAFGKVGCTPVFYDHAQGSHVWDVDGNEYVDFICSWGPMILGHGDADVLGAVRAQLDRGVSYADGTWIVQYGKQQAKRWAGITAIDDTTPGFVPVLAEGDEMRLYQIVDGA